MTVVRELKTRVKQAMLNVLAIARCCSAVLASEGVDGADEEVALLREELELLRARLRRSRPIDAPFVRCTVL